jgi:hypothetical protein
MGEATAQRSRLTLTSTSVMNFTPLANGVNNSISIGTQYAEFAGTFNLNLGGADNTIGDTWALVTVAAAGSNIVDSTFSVAGATEEGNTGIWDDYANSVDYQYNDLTGVLTVVPEPSTFALIGLGLGCAMLLRRKSNRA